MSVIFGTAAGFIGGLLAVDYLYPTTWSDSSSSRLVSTIRGGSIGEDVVRPSAPVESAARAEALFFRKTSGVSLESQVFWPSKAVAAGVVLTSDGWLVSHQGWPADSDPAAAVAVIGSRVYEVDQAVTDSASGVMFMKVEASNLPVIGFDESSWPEPGEPLFAYDPSQGPRRLDLVGYGPRPAAGADDLVASSDLLDKFLRLPSADGVLPGSMVLNRNGQVAAVFAGNDAIGSSAIPVREFSDQLEPVVREQAASRPFLGVNYVDLARLVGGESRRGGQTRGALLAGTSDGKTLAVVRKSPAEAAGLRAGDVILEVNGEQVSAKRSLADIIRDYRPETEVTLTVLRGAFAGNANWQATGRTGGEIEVEVTLGRLP